MCKRFLVLILGLMLVCIALEATAQPAPPPQAGLIERFRVAHLRIWQPTSDGSFQEAGELDASQVDPKQLTVLSTPDAPYIQVSDGSRIMWLRRSNLEMRPGLVSSGICDPMHFVAKDYDHRSQGSNEPCR